MPMLKKSGKPRKKELPSTIARSSKGAQRTFAKVHDAAAEEYGEGRRAHQTAYAALKHSYEKVGNHWERKATGGRAKGGRAKDARAKGGHAKGGHAKGGQSSRKPATRRS